MTGFRCTHAYAHANAALKKTLPFALKGLDAIVYATFKHLGTQVNVLPVLEDGALGNDEYEARSSDEEGRDIIGGTLYPTGLDSEEHDESASVAQVRQPALTLISLSS